MKRVEQAVLAVREDSVGCAVLEVTCGCAEFSLEAAKIARTVCCIDLDAEQL